MAVTKIHPIKTTLKKALNYLLAGNKTDGGNLVTSFACSPETADIEFGFTLSHCVEKGSNLAFHLIQSFKPGETDAKTSHEIGAKLAQAFLGGKYEYVLSTHVDKGHIHNHLIFCAANFQDYRKFVTNKRTYYQIRSLSDRYCEEAGLSVIDPKSIRGNSYQEYMAKKGGYSWKNKVRRAIDMALKACVSYEEFIIKMNLLGIEVQDTKGITFRVTGENSFVSGSSLGYKYLESRIIERINTNRQATNLSLVRVKLKWQNSYLTSNPKSTRALRELKKTVSAINFLLAGGINSFGLLEQRIEEGRNALFNIKEEIRRLENKVNELAATDKQFRVLKFDAIPKGSMSSDQIDYYRNTVIGAANHYLTNYKDRKAYGGREEIAQSLDRIRGQLEDLYKNYNEIKRSQKKLQTARWKIKQLVKMEHRQDLERS